MNEPRELLIAMLIVGGLFLFMALMLRLIKVGLRLRKRSKLRPAPPEQWMKPQKREVGSSTTSWRSLAPLSTKSASGSL